MHSSIVSYCCTEDDQKDGRIPNKLILCINNLRTNYRADSH